MNDVVVYLAGVATPFVLAGLWWLQGSVRWHLKYHGLCRKQRWKEGYEPRAVSIMVAPWIGLLFRSGLAVGYRPPGWPRRTVALFRPRVSAPGWPDRIRVLW